MGKVIIPEIIILNTLKNVFKLVREDYKAQTDKTKTYLYRILGTLNLERYTFFSQAIKVLVADIDDPRYLEVQLFFNLQRQGLPTIHITLPNENSGPGGLGIDEGYQEPEEGSEPDTVRDVLSRRFDTTYNIVITSDNTNEVILLYHFIRAILIPVFEHFDSEGLQNNRLSGGDLNIDPRLIPQNIFVRAIHLSFSYDVNVAKLFDQSIVNQLVFRATIIDEENDESESSYTETIVDID